MIHFRTCIIIFSPAASLATSDLCRLQHRRSPTVWLNDDEDWLGFDWLYFLVAKNSEGHTRSCVVVILCRDWIPFSILITLLNSVTRTCAWCILERKEEIKIVLKMYPSEFHFVISSFSQHPEAIFPHRLLCPAEPEVKWVYLCTTRHNKHNLKVQQVSVGKRFAFCALIREIHLAVPWGFLQSKPQHVCQSFRWEWLRGHRSPSYKSRYWWAASEKNQA